MNIRYLAGLFDGEGCIQLRIHHYRDKRWPENRAVQRRCHLDVLINMTDPRAIREVHAMYGGRFKKRRKPAKPTHRFLHYWVISQGQAADLLKKMLPHLLIKKEEAIVALRYNAHMNRRKRGRTRGDAVTEAEWQFREDCITELKRLKHVIYE